jgi:hypothetical protein
MPRGAFLMLGSFKLGMLTSRKAHPSSVAFYTKKRDQFGCIVTLGIASWSCVANTLTSTLQHRRRAAVAISRRG